MPNIAYWTHGDAEAEAVAAQIRTRRGGVLLNLDRILLHSTPVATGWGGFMGRVRNELSLSAFHRELAICAVARHTGADYEYHHHVPLLASAGASPAQIGALDQLAAAAANTALFDAAARAVLQFTLESTRDVTVCAETLAAVRAVLPDERSVVELLVLVAAYNMVARILVGARVEIEQT